MMNGFLFESFANSKRYKTSCSCCHIGLWFESFANSKRYKTYKVSDAEVPVFESFANSKRYNTSGSFFSGFPCLRALLIQKDTKQMI